ncbi:MAG: hypothetical protein QOJ39_2334 [Candidatus Eremiobacteraeota bacterium]|jgi:hypothetical protein|nr:hypothetical protein [Candidatus Eremiobacteraeota bacterium]
MADKHVSEGLIAYGERIATERNMGTLTPGEHLPYNYFSPSRVSGKIEVAGTDRVSVAGAAVEEKR